MFLGATFNTENSDTDYKTGTQVHLDGTVAQHFPLWSGLAGAGLSGYYYQQVTGDSGDAANLGDFKGKTTGIGPVVSYTRKLNNSEFLASFKWLHEVSTKNRLQGNTLFLKAMLKY
ncbi:MAG: transporter [Gammaproteobacteria bacterium]